MAPYSLLGLLTLGLLVPDALAAPKAPWANQRAKGFGRRAFGASIDKRWDLNQRDTCVVKDALDIEAPKENIWGGLTEPEAVSVVHWLFAQPDLNLTITDDAGSWDNTL